MEPMKKLTGKQAVEFHLTDSNGNTHALSPDGVHWQLLIFHRHLG